MLTALSFGITLHVAGDEPFFVFRWGEALLIVGLGTLTVALFIVWAFACVRTCRRTLRKRTAFAVSGGCVLWSAVNVFYTGTSVTGYLEDVTTDWPHQRLPVPAQPLVPDDK